MINLLQVRDLCVEVDGQEILHSIDLTIPDGEVHALLEPNGSGKTTLMMALIDYPGHETTRGQVLFDGQDVTDLDITERARLGIGVTQQRPPTIAGVKLRQILHYVVAHAPQRAQTIDQLVRAFQMEPFLERDINAVPGLRALHPEARMSHEASVGKIAPEQVAYPQSRGMEEREAIPLIIRGFLDADVEGLSPELDVRIAEIAELAGHGEE
jgi:ABC-type branched-subunit amino acid transport system ATPase component